MGESVNMMFKCESTINRRKERWEGKVVEFINDSTPKTPQFFRGIENYIKIVKIYFKMLKYDAICSIM